jgi:hypothetical protein
MYTTLETRWFFEQEPNDIVEWVKAIPAWPLDSEITLGFTNDWERSDFYLVLDGYAKLSFKMREGTAEMKVLDENFGLRHFSNIARGYIERWNKFTMPLQAAFKFPLDIFQNPHQFIELKKERLLIKHEVNNLAEVRRVDPKRNDISNGFQLELTRIEVNATRYYSFAFEAFGDDDVLFSNFHQLTETVFSTLQSHELTQDNSYAYPAFLQKL